MRGLSDLSAGKLGPGHRGQTADKALGSLEAKEAQGRWRLGGVSAVKGVTVLGAEVVAWWGPSGRDLGLLSCALRWHCARWRTPTLSFPRGRELGHRKWRWAGRGQGRGGWVTPRTAAGDTHLLRVGPSSGTCLHSPAPPPAVGLEPRHPRLRFLL